MTDEQAEVSWAEFAPLTARAIAETMEMARKHAARPSDINPHSFAIKVGMHVGTSIECEVKALRERIDELEEYVRSMGLLVRPVENLPGA